MPEKEEAVLVEEEPFELPADKDLPSDDAMSIEPSFDAHEDDLDEDEAHFDEVEFEAEEDGPAVASARRDLNLAVNTVLNQQVNSLARTELDVAEARAHLNSHRLRRALKTVLRAEKALEDLKESVLHLRRSMALLHNSSVCASLASASCFSRSFACSWCSKCLSRTSYWLMKLCSCSRSLVFSSPCFRRSSS